MLAQRIAHPVAPQPQPAVAPPARPPARAVAAARAPELARDDALGALLSRCVRERAAAPAAPLLLRKTADEQSAKQRRVANARATIALLGANIKDGLDRHVFDAMPVAGALVKSAPTGLHAYKDKKLPTGVTGTVSGNENKVHTLTWHWNGFAGDEKDSTMFPKWMASEHVRTLIALKYREERKTAVPDTALSPTDAKTYITRGTRVELDKSGDTVYPVL
jgi:hypothetical protein